MFGLIQTQTSAFYAGQAWPNITHRSCIAARAAVVCRFGTFGYIDDMNDIPQSRLRWLWPTPGLFTAILLAVECLLILSERFQWLAFNQHKGLTVLIALAAVGVTILFMFMWFIAALIFRLRFQFSIRSLL